MRRGKGTPMKLKHRIAPHVNVCLRAAMHRGTFVGIPSTFRLQILLPGDIFQSF